MTSHQDGSFNNDALAENKTTMPSSILTSLSIPEEFICPITHEIMVDPVVSRYEQSYERMAIIEWLASGIHACPLTRQPMTLKDVVTNNRLRIQIEHWCENQNVELSQLVEKRNSKTYSPQQDAAEGRNGKDRIQKDTNNDQEEEDNHRALRGAFMDLPESLLNLLNHGENGSTGHSSDGEEELTEVRVRRVEVLSGETRYQRPAEETSRRRSLFRRFTRSAPR